MDCVHNFLGFFGGLLVLLPAEPFTFGAWGVAAAIAFVLFELAVAIGFHVLFRRTLRKRLRLAVSLVLALLALAGGVYIYVITASYDATVIQRYQETKSSNNADSPHNLTAPRR